VDPPAHRRTVVVALLALIAVAYGGSLRNELVFDELIFMQRDARVQSLTQVDRIFSEALWSSGEPHDPHVHQYYRPLQLLPLALSHAAFGTAAWPSHLLNLLLHLGNCLLAYGLYRALLRRPGTAATVVLLFAVQPAYSEAVLWVSDVAGLGAAFCALAIVRLHAAAQRARWWAWLLSPLLLLAGVWFKESGVLAVALAAAYDLAAAPDRGPRRLWRLRWRYAVFAPPLALYAVLRLRAIGGALPGIETVPLTRGALLLNAVALLPEYARTFCWPFDLNMYHDFDAVSALAEPRVVAGGALAAAGALLCAGALRRQRAAAFGLLWAALAVAPHLLVRWPQLNVFAERYLYLPSVGLFLALGSAWERVAGRLSARARRAAALTVTVLLAVCVAVDVRRTRDWHDELTIYRKTLTQSTRAELIRTNLAVRLLELRQYDEGIAVLEALQRINPDWPDTWHNLGLLYLGKGDGARATDAFEAALRENPRKSATLLNLGYLYDRAGQRDAAVQMYLRLVDQTPRAGDAWYNLGAIALELGQLDNARLAAQRVLALKPDDAEARALLRRAATAAPAPAPAPVTLERCARAKAAADAGRYGEAILALESAAWFDEAAALPHHYLANVYYLQGRLADAVREQREALRRAPDRPLYRANLHALEAALAAQQRAAPAAPAAPLTPSRDAS
jgi:tetratricopeptide (TPR) repeat protein